MHVLKFRFLEFSNTLEDYFFVPLKDDSVTVQTLVFQIGTSLFIFH